MPCLADMMDCLLCGTQTDCVQINEEPQADSVSKDKWPKPFCKLLCIEDETLEQKLFDSYYCVQCSFKIKSINQISTLIVNMTTKLAEIRATVEDNLYLSNPHLYGKPDEDENTQPGEKNQNDLRAQMISVLEEVKRAASESKQCDASVLTDPVVILDDDDSGMKKAPGTDADGEEDTPENEPYYIILPDNSEVDNQNSNANLTLKSDKASQCTLLSNGSSHMIKTDDNSNYSSMDQNDEDVDDTTITPNGRESKKQRQRQLIKIRINSDSVSEDIINTLRLQSGSGSSQTRQLIIRGYREIEVPQPVRSHSKASEGKSPICIDLDNEADISIAQAQQQQPVGVHDEKSVDTPVSAPKRRGRPPLSGSASKVKTTPKPKSKSAKLKSRSGSGKIIQCPVCDAECENMNARRLHVETVHKEDGLYVCPHCKVTYKSERTLFNHQKVHLESEIESESEEEQEVEPEYESEVADDAVTSDNNNDELEEDEDEDEDEDDEDDYVMEDDEDDEDWVDTESTSKKTKASSKKSTSVGRGRSKSTSIVKETSQNASTNKSLQPAVPAPVPPPVDDVDINESVNDGNSEKIEVELVQMNPEDYGDFVTDQDHTVASNNNGIPKSIPPPDRKSNKRKSVQIPRAVEAIIEAAKRPKLSPNGPVIKVASNKKVVGMPELYPEAGQMTPGHPGQGQATVKESSPGSGSPRKSGRLRPKYRQYFY